MKKLVLLFAALLVAGCGEKSSSEGSESAGEKPTPSNEDVKPSADSPEPLISDADVERFAKDAMDSGVPPDDYTGWSKIVDRGQLVELVQWKNGEPDGPCMLWYENGKIWDMSLNREGKMVQRQTYYRTGEKQSSMSPADDGLQEMVAWHKNGKKAGSGIIKDGEPVMKFWDDKGQELDQEEGMKMMDQLLD